MARGGRATSRDDEDEAQWLLDGLRPAEDEDLGEAAPVDPWADTAENLLAEPVPAPPAARSDMSTSDRRWAVGRPVGRGGFMASRMKIRHPGKAWAYTGAIVAGGLSVAANVASVVPSVASTRVLPAVAGLWPVLLFIGFEILVRVSWVRRYKWAGWLGMSAVVSVPAIVSYRHMYGLLERLGEDRVICIMGPLALDGLMLMATMALMSMAQAARAGTDAPRPEPRSSTPFPPLGGLFRDAEQPAPLSRNGFGRRR